MRLLLDPMLQCMIAAALTAVVLLCPRASTDAERREAAMDRFLQAISPGRKFDEDDILRAAGACFRVGRPAADYDRVLSQAAEKVARPGGKWTAYTFYPGARKGEEGDYALTIVVEGECPVIKECCGGILVR